MRLLVTRPQPQASDWVDQLRQHGIDAAALPLIAIEGPADPLPVQALWHELNDTKLLMFVSPSAVDWFFRLRPLEQRWPAHTWAAAPGPGTARALREIGATSGLMSEHIMSPPADADQFDSETLWPVLQPLDWQGQTVAIISGGDRQDARGRAWLSDQLRAHGATVKTLLTYQRGPARWTPEQSALAQTASQRPEQHLWLLSSSEAIEHLTTHLRPGQRWDTAMALVTHPRIADRAREAGFGRIISCRPTLAAVVSTLRSIE